MNGKQAINRQNLGIKLLLYLKYAMLCYAITGATKTKTTLYCKFKQENNTIDSHNLRRKLQLKKLQI